MSRLRLLAVIPFNAALVYAWMTRQVVRGIVRGGERLWPQYPIDHP